SAVLHGIRQPERNTASQITVYRGFATDVRRSEIGLILAAPLRVRRIRRHPVRSEQRRPAERRAEVVVQDRARRVFLEDVASTEAPRIREIGRIAESDLRQPTRELEPLSAMEKVSVSVL